ncbi:MAG: Hsp70 family protein, partial [Deltaproteobacteria bacterium]|nr:Hsp70 family protein [Deltaproteobacteria bacterium]
ELSSTMETEINLPFITADASGPKHLVMKLTRAKCESLVHDILEKTTEPCRKCLKDAGKQSSDINEVILVGGSTRIPKVQEMVKTFFGREPHKGVNPDEVVAAGAAVQAGVLTGEVRDVLLLDVTPLSLGIETLGGVLTRLIERNTTIPTRKSQIFSTAADNQTSVEVHVLQGEREMAADNRSLGRFILEGIPTAPRGMPQVEVSFDIDANGILHVGAKDMATQKEQKITITASSGLAKDDVEKLVRQAKDHEAEDKKRREEIDLRNLCDAHVYGTEKTLNEKRAKIPAEDAKRIEEAIAACKTALESKEAATIKAAMEGLTKASHKMAEAMYKASAQAQTAREGQSSGNGSGEPKAKKDEKVVDAEYEEMK